MKLGDVEIISILENKFKVDAGSMFGIIPKVIWGKMVKADEDNRVDLDINPLIVRTGREILVIDAGFGDILTEKQAKIYGLEGPTRWPQELAAHGLKAEDITGVIFTHLHADHAMGALERSPDGRPRLRFPNAKLYVQVREWRDAMNPDERTSATYLVENLKVFELSGKLELLDGGLRLLPHIEVKLIGGHTPGMQAVIIEGGGLRVIYPGDLIPLQQNLKVPYVGAIDLDPATTMKWKRWLHKKMLEENWILAFDHDIKFKFARMTLDKNGKPKLERYAV
jgi:glyoxylase-like metal-dependent hydrolase (beta-lactamase superfamily II)